MNVVPYSVERWGSNVKMEITTDQHKLPTSTTSEPICSQLVHKTNMTNMFNSTNWLDKFQSCTLNVIISAVCGRVIHKLYSQAASSKKILFLHEWVWGFSPSKKKERNLANHLFVCCRGGYRFNCIHNKLVYMYGSVWSTVISCFILYEVMHTSTLFVWSNMLGWLFELE